MLVQDQRLLTGRLARIADLAGRGRTVADIGSDHAQVPLALVESGRFESAIAVELSAGPLAATRLSVSASTCARLVDVRQGDGLRPLRAGEVDAIVIAGMGASTMWDILTSDHAAGLLMDEPPRFVLQPMSGSGLMRFWAAKMGYELVADVRVGEAELVYECLLLSPPSCGVVADPSTFGSVWRAEYLGLPATDRMLYACGSNGLAVRCEWLKRQLDSELSKRQAVLGALAHPRSDAAAARMVEVRAEYGALFRFRQEYFS